MPGQGNNTVPNVVADRPTVINGFAGTSRCSVIAISIFAGSVSWLQSNRINKSVVQCESKRIAGIKVSFNLTAGAAETMYYICC